MVLKRISRSPAIESPSHVNFDGMENKEETRLVNETLKGHTIIPAKLRAEQLRILRA
jgi:hypothetical protein